MKITKQKPENTGTSFGNNQFGYFTMLANKIIKSSNSAFFDKKNQFNFFYYNFNLVSSFFRLKIIF